MKTHGVEVISNFPTIACFQCRGKVLAGWEASLRRGNRVKIWAENGGSVAGWGRTECCLSRSNSSSSVSLFAEPSPWASIGLVTYRTSCAKSLGFDLLLMGLHCSSCVPLTWPVNAVKLTMMRVLPTVSSGVLPASGVSLLCRASSPIFGVLGRMASKSCAFKMLIDRTVIQLRSSGLHCWEVKPILAQMRAKCLPALHCQSGGWSPH